MEFLEGLNEEQQRVVLSKGRPILVIAGAGSGKTKTIVHKALYLIQNQEFLVRAKRLLLITFTNKAANEIKERIKKYAPNSEISWIGTFHSVAARIIRTQHHLFGLSKDFRVLDEDDTKKLFQTLLKNTDIKKEDGKKLFIKVNQAIEGILFLDEDNNFDKQVLDYKESFINLMIEQNAVSFSYLIGGLKQKLEENQDLRAYYQKYFDYIIIDEFQDTNTSQYEIVKYISKEDNICVIGDPNQCIYEWRMAHPDNIMSFINDFNPEIIKLGTNYRSLPTILNLANDVLTKSKASWKDLVPTLKSQKTDDNIKPILTSHINEEEEARFIAKKIAELKDKIPYEEMAILVRAGFITDFIEKALASYKIPYMVVGALKFFQRKEIKDILSYVYFAINPKDSISFERAISNPKRGIGEKTIDRIINLSKQKSIDLIKASELILSNKLFQENPFLIAIKRLKNNLEKDPSSLAFHIQKLIQDIDYYAYLEKEYKDDAEERKENLKELVRFFETQHITDIKEFLQELSLLEEDEESKSNAVKVMTIHKAKGLEFEVVFLPRLENGILPHAKSFDDIASMEEERRLFYVAITRAKKHLFMSYTQNGVLSNFAEELDKNLIDTSYLPKNISNIVSKTINTHKSITQKQKNNSSHNINKGDIVKHDVFGEGTVISVDMFNGIAKVKFKDKERSISKDFLKTI